MGKKEKRHGFNILSVRQYQHLKFTLFLNLYSTESHFPSHLLQRTPMHLFLAYLFSKSHCYSCNSVSHDHIFTLCYHLHQTKTSLKKVLNNFNVAFVLVVCNIHEFDQSAYSIVHPFASPDT